MGGRLARRIVEEQELPNAPKVQPQGKVMHAEFCETIRRLCQVATYQVGQRGNRHEVADTSRNFEFLGINPPSFTCSSVIEDPENFVEVLQKSFDILHVVDAERLELVAYQLNCIARVWFNQWKRNMVEDAPIVSWDVFENTFMGRFIPRELQEENIRDFLTLNDSCATS